MCARPPKAYPVIGLLSATILIIILEWIERFFIQQMLCRARLLCATYYLSGGGGDLKSSSFKAVEERRLPEFEHRKPPAGVKVRGVNMLASFNLPRVFSLFFVRQTNATCSIPHPDPLSPHAFFFLKILFLIYIFIKKFPPHDKYTRFMRMYVWSAPASW